MSQGVGGLYFLDTIASDEFNKLRVYEMMEHFTIRLALQDPRMKSNMKNE